MDKELRIYENKELLDYLKKRIPKDVELKRIVGKGYVLNVSRLTPSDAFELSVIIKSNFDRKNSKFGDYYLEDQGDKLIISSIKERNADWGYLAKTDEKLTDDIMRSWFNTEEEKMSKIKQYNKLRFEEGKSAIETYKILFPNEKPIRIKDFYPEGYDYLKKPKIESNKDKLKKDEQLRKKAKNFKDTKEMIKYLGLNIDYDYGYAYKSDGRIDFEDEPATDESTYRTETFEEISIDKTNKIVYVDIISGYVEDDEGYQLEEGVNTEKFKRDAEYFYTKIPEGWKLIVSASEAEEPIDNIEFERKGIKKIKKEITKKKPKKLTINQRYYKEVIIDSSLCQRGTYKRLKTKIDGVEILQCKLKSCVEKNGVKSCDLVNHAKLYDKKYFKKENNKIIRKM